MLEFHNLRKIYNVSGVEKIVINRLNMIFPEKRNIAILGHNGAGKSTFMRLIAGAELPTEGRVVRHGNISWPLGFSGGYSGPMTGIECARFVARMYGEDTERIIDYVDDFAELGKSMKLPIETYSSGMKARLAFGVSMAINFQTYLIDEITAVGDERFKRKCTQVFEEKLEEANIIMVSHSATSIRKFCESGCVLDGGELVFYEDLEEAIAVHSENQKQ